MGKSAYPTAKNLSEFLSGAGLTLTNAQELFLPAAATAARLEFERRTDRVFLAGASAQRRTDPPTAHVDGETILFLPWDAATITAVSYQPTNATAETWTEGEDYDLLPYHASTVGLPIDRLRIYGKRWLGPLTSQVRRSIYLTGTWGYGATIPEDAWLGMLNAGALQLWQQITQYTTGGRLSYKDDEVAEDFGILPWQSAAAAWRSQLDGIVNRYRRIVL